MRVGKRIGSLIAAGCLASGLLGLSMAVPCAAPGQPVAGDGDGDGDGDAGVPGCQASGFNPNLLPTVATPYVPLPFSVQAFRLARNSGLAGLIPSIGAFADTIADGSGPSAGISARRLLFQNFDMATFRSLAFPPGTLAIDTPTFAAPTSGTGVAPARAVIGIYENQQLLDPSGMRCAAGDFYSQYQLKRLKPSDVAENLIDILALESTSPFRISAPPNHALFMTGATDLVKQTLRADGLSLDRSWTSGLVGPLSGVPLVIKGQFDVSGFPASVGTRWGRFPVDSGPSAEVVDNLVSDGHLIAIGDLNMHELGGGVTGENPYYGAVRNGYDSALISGGSSSAVAAAVAMNVAPIGIGSDAGGSTRIPAAYNGLYGLKPTYGSMSNDGNYPLAESLTQPGPMARSVRDLWAAAILMSDRADYWSGPPITDLANFHGPGRPLQIGVHEEWNAQAAPDVRDAFDRGLRVLTGAGAMVHRIDRTGRGLPHLPWVTRAQILLFAHALRTQLAADPRFDASATSAEQRIAVQMGTLSATVTDHQLNATDIHRAKLIRGALTRAVDQVFCAGIDVIATPTSGVMPRAIATDYMPDGASDIIEVEKTNRYTTLANMTGHPALTMPVEKYVGLQLIGRPHAERELLTIAYAFESRHGWHRTAPVKDLCPLKARPRSGGSNAPVPSQVVVRARNNHFEHHQDARCPGFRHLVSDATGPEQSAAIPVMIDPSTCATVSFDPHPDIDLGTWTTVDIIDEVQCDPTFSVVVATWQSRCTTRVDLAYRWDPNRRRSALWFSNATLVDTSDPSPRGGPSRCTALPAGQYESTLPAGWKVDLPKTEYDAYGQPVCATPQL